MQDNNQPLTNGIAPDSQTPPTPPTGTGDQNLAPSPMPTPVTQAPLSSQPANNSPTPLPANQIPIGVSASQMGLNQSKNKLFDISPRQLLTKGLVAIVVLGVTLFILIVTNVIALTKFKTTSYINAKGVHYKMAFYTKHSSKTLQSGTMQLVSKVSEDGKFPLALSIAEGDVSDYGRVKDCASFTKLFDVQNNKVDQKISVCDFGKQASGQNTTGVVYIAGFTQNNQSHIVTISQDYSGIDLSSSSAAQAALARFGMDPYKEDIEKILSSVTTE